MKIRNSILDGKTLVVEVEHGDDGPFVEMLKSRENGYAIFGEAVETPVAVIDGRLMEEPWFTSDHLLAIEAHELGHILTESEEEPIAECRGIVLLQAAGFHEAAQILIDRGVI